MKNLAQLVDDLLAFRRGEIAFDAVTDHVSSQLIATPQAAEDVLRQIDAALDRKLIEPSQVVYLKTIVADTIAPFNSQLTQRIRGDLIDVRGDARGEAQRPAAARKGTSARPIARSNIPLGTRLRERFVLDEVIGAGGMGTVYKGRDLLKVEARDRNPYVAIKVLNDDFRKRDDAFIVLQREASRQQRLAHPNVATVYDFDRTGDTIFISMELLEGVPLDTYLKTESRSGIDWTAAQGLIDGMGAALAYAHEHGIVHADFKPSNCFLMKDGKVKVLDFGIARAIKRPNQGQSDATVYDGASIGALTPAYASAEMLEGTSDPDPSDDVYGLACVCYELLSGKHPYNSLSAREARYQRLGPKRIEGLTTKQNRALQRALAFERASRTPSVREFVQELTLGGAAHSFWNRKRIAVTAVVILLSSGAVAWYALEYPVARTLADMRSNDPQTVQTAIDRLPSLRESDRVRVMTAARPDINAYYQRQVRRMLDTGEIDAAYAKAEAMLATGLSTYPDSGELLQLRDEVARRKDRYLSELAEQYETYLAAGRLLKSREHGDIQGVMQRIRLVDPKHPLLTDPRVPGAFATAAETAINAGKLDNAQALLADATELAPTNRVLRDVSDKLATAEQQARLRSKSDELTAQIETQIAGATSLDKVVSVTGALTDLREIDPNHAVLSRAAAAVRPLLGTDYESIGRIATVDDIAAFEQRYEPTFDALGLSEASSRVAARRQALESRRDRLLSDARVLARTPGASKGSAATLADLLKQARALAPSDPQIGTIATEAVAARRSESQRLTAAGQWKDARDMLTAALTLDGSDAVRAQISQDVARIDQRQRDSAQQTLLAEREAAQAAERDRIATAESQVSAALAGFAATAQGLESLSARIAALAAIDPGNAMIQSARTAAAQRVAAAANESAQAGKFDQAHALLAKAAIELPGAVEIATARGQVDGLRSDASKRAQERAVIVAQQAFRALIDRPRTSDPTWQKDAEAAIAAIKKTSPNGTAAESARSELANVYLASSDQLVIDKRFTIANQMLDKAEQLAPRTAALQTRRDQWTRAFERDKAERTAAEATAKLDAAKQRLANEIKSNQLERARRTLTELQAAAGNDAFVTREAPAMLADAYLSSAQTRLRAGDVTSAWRLASAGAAVRGDDARFAALRSDIDTTASRRMEALLSAPGTIDGAALAALATTYRTNAPERYRAQGPGWTTRIKNQLADLATEPTAHNTYLLAVQSAFEDLAAIQSIRPVAPRQVVASSRVPSTNSAPSVVSSAPDPAPLATASHPVGVAQQPQQGTVAASTAVEPTLIGKWCGEGVGMTFASNEYSFDLGGGRTVKYPVDRYQRAGGTITMTWTDKNLGAMLTEFGDFTADGQTMMQMRGKTAAASQWQTYNRKFKKCN